MHANYSYLTKKSRFFNLGDAFLDFLRVEESPALAIRANAGVNLRGRSLSGMRNPAISLSASPLR